MREIYRKEVDRETDRIKGKKEDREKRENKEEIFLTDQQKALHLFCAIR